jgi:hypothetical protein
MWFPFGDVYEEKKGHMSNGELMSGFSGGEAIHHLPNEGQPVTQMPGPAGSRCSLDVPVCFWSVSLPGLLFDLQLGLVPVKQASATVLIMFRRFLSHVHVIYVH